MARVFTVKVENEEISLHELRKAFIRNPEAMASLLSEVMNTFGNQYLFGFATGQESRDPVHRSLQRSIIAFTLGVLSGISDQEHTDPRNGDAIYTAKKIRKMFESGDLDIGAMI